MATPKKKGQHDVQAIIRLYSDEGFNRLGVDDNGVEFKELHTDVAGKFTLVEVRWRPRPSRNQWNTESDWRRWCASTFEGLYFDVLDVTYDWKEVD